jgi:hypothetical protein
MELDSLKEIWNDAGEKKGQQPGNAEILDMLGKSSRSPVAKMIRNIFMEMIVINVAMGGVAVFYFLAFKGRFNSISWLYIGTACLTTFYYYRKWKLLRGMQCVACQVKSNLQLQVNTLGKYVRFYLIAGTAIVPVLFIFLGILFYYNFPSGKFYPLFPPLFTTSVAKWTLWALTQSVVTALFYIANKWFINKLYGRHVQKLRELISQMEEE